MSYFDTDNISLEIKYIFLNFLQNFFGQNSQTTYRWREDPRTTDIIVADKFSVDIGVATRRPTIAISRGRMAWTYTVRGQYGFKNPTNTAWRFGALDPVPLDADRFTSQQLTDLLHGSILFNVISKQGMVAEDIANKLFIALTGHKDDLRSIGIFKILSLDVSEEQLLKYQGDVELYGVAVSMSFLMKKDIMAADKAWNCRVWVDGVEVFENIHFRVLPTGTQIKFFEEQDSNSVVTISFTDAITLELRSNVIMSTTDYYTYTIPNDWGIYGYYKIVAAIIIDNYVKLQDSDFYVTPEITSTTYYIDKYSPEGTIVGNPVTDPSSYLHRILVGEYSLDPGDPREYTYTLVSGNIDDAFVVTNDGTIVVNDSSAINQDFSLTMAVVGVTEPVIIEVQLND